VEARYPNYGTWRYSIDRQVSDTTKDPKNLKCGKVIHIGYPEASPTTGYSVPVPPSFFKEILLTFVKYIITKKFY
jgi:hypothetical protein